MCHHDKSTKLFFLAPEVQGQQFLKHSYIQPLKYYLVPHEEKWYAHLRSDVIKLQIISITKPHRQSYRIIYAFSCLISQTFHQARHQQTTTVKERNNKERKEKKILNKKIDKNKSYT